MKPTTRRGRTAALAVLAIAVLLVLGLLAAVGWTAYWVDVVPGGDAGLATSPELEAGRLAARLLGGALLLLGTATLTVLLAQRRRRRPVAG